MKIVYFILFFFTISFHEISFHLWFQRQYIIKGNLIFKSISLEGEFEKNGACGVGGVRGEGKRSVQHFILFIVTFVSILYLFICTGCFILFWGSFEINSRRMSFVVLMILIVYRYIDPGHLDHKNSSLGEITRHILYGSSTACIKGDKSNVRKFRTRDNDW